MNNKRVLYFLSCLVLLLLFSGCSTPRHSIAGTTFGWPKAGIETLSDVQVSGLQVRHVRNHNNPSKCTSGFTEHLELNGPIGPDSTFVVEEFLRKINKCTYDGAGNWYTPIVYLNSNGGLVAHGYKLGAMFKKHGVTAFITGQQICASSCAIAFLGAKWRAISYDGKLIFHAPYVYDANGINCSSQQGIDELKKYYVEFLGKTSGERLFSRTMDYCSTSDGWALNKDAAQIYGLLNPK